MLGANRLSRREFEFVLPDHDHLITLADERYLDATVGAIVDGLMLETVDVEIRVQFAIDPPQQVEIEFCRDALAVVVGGLDRRDIFLQVDAHQETATATAQSGDPSQHAEDG